MLFLAVFLSSMYCQNDTLLFENFQSDPSSEMLLFPSGNDLNWVNLDEDGIPDFNNYPKNWFQALDFRYAAGLPVIGDTNFVFVSSSWLFNSVDGNRNWLILPPLEITDDQAVLSWKSAPFQCPLFTDGYAVLVSTTGNDPQAENFNDTIFRAAQNKPPWPLQNSLNATDYVFSPGYIHAEGLTLQEYLFYDPSSPDTAYTGLLEPHEISLSEYAGNTIYITFLHDSDDDYLIAIDDILVKGTAPSSAENLEHRFQIKVFPNPAEDQVTYSFYLQEAQSLSIRLKNTQGVDIKTVLPFQKMSSGSHKFDIDLKNLAAGVYFIQLYAENDVTSQKLIKI